MFKKVVVGVSGGVDSCVSALLLKQKGYNVTGLFMLNWDQFDESSNCNITQDLNDAKYICNKLDIPLVEVNFVKEYWTDVFIKLINDYENGFTPNPDILCNKFIKFDYFYKYARDVLKADAIATGHYARTSFGCYLEHFKPDQDVKLLKSRDILKDQTFFLCQIPQFSLRLTMFPLGEYLKNEVKNIAKKFGFEKILKKRESVGICFIGKRNFQQFICEYLPPNPGSIVNIVNNKIIGEHVGLYMWTVGQRCPLGTLPLPFYVASKDVKNNILYVTDSLNNSLLFSTIFYTENPFFINPNFRLTPGDLIDCEFRFQHAKPLMKCQLFCLNNGKVLVVLKYPLRALTIGQFAVFYKQNVCLGSARILKIGPNFYSLGLNIPNESKYFEKNEVFHCREVKKLVNAYS